MSSKELHSPRLLLTRLVLYLMLWQLLGSELKIQMSTAAQPSLLKSEVDTLTAIISKLGLKPAPYIELSFCQDKVSSYGITFGCDCSFDGYTVCRITSISFSSVALSTVIPDEVGSLPYLLYLSLSNNKLQGRIPETLGNLNRLISLDLSYNQLSGKIPDALGSMSSLRYLYLHYNRLEGSIPSSLGSLSDLRELDLQFNKFTHSIPDELGKLSRLTNLYLSENQLTGPLPSTLGNLNSLQYFYVSANGLTETFPDTYSQLVNLRRFSIAGNYISGPLPVHVVTNWAFIEVLNLMGNNFKGTLTPEIFDNLQNLQYVLITDLENDGFELPVTIKNTKFISLILRNCSIRGPIRDYIGEMPSLRYLDLSFNQLTGEIPYLKSDLFYILLAGNMLNGTIPDWILKLDGTKRDLSFNNFSTMDSEPPKSPDLNLFACCPKSPATAPPDMMDPYEMMNTYCPRKKQKYHSLFINCGGGETIVNGKIYDQDNGTTPFYTSPKKNWAYSFSGDFLSQNTNASDYTKNITCGVSVADAPLYDKARLSPVSLKYFAFCLREGKYNVTLHFAEIVYTEDAASYSGSRKRAFDVYIQGERQLTDFKINEKAGGPDKPITKNFTAVVNENLLKIHLYWTGKGSSDNPPAFNGPLISAISVIPDFKVEDEEFTPLHIALITIASISTALLLLVALAWRMGWLETTKYRDINVGQNKSVTVKQLIAATEKFNDKKTKIGSGGFGAVYEAKLQGDLTVAVKKLSANFKEKIQELKNEIAIITTLEHDNLIKLLDVHIEKDLQILVYEYMKNKSLKEALFDPKSPVKLSWDNRFNIILGVAKGLEYLHNHRTVKLVHMNIKPANILLDENLEAKISDFGLARLYREEDQLMVIQNEMRQGYAALECYQGNITDKADVFSFGMVVLEIVSGKKSVASKPNKESVLLLDTAHKYEKSKDLLSLVDEKLGDDCNTKQAHTILTLAVKCTSSGYSNRPTMSEIVTKLMISMEDSNLSLTPASNEGEKTNASSKSQAKAPSTDSPEVSTFSPAFGSGDMLV